MAKDTVTLTLNGEIPLPLFAKAVSYFSALIQSLSEEVIGPNEIEWDVIHLEGGSAVLRARGTNGPPEDIEKTVDAYTDVAHAVKQGREIPFSDTVALNAKGIVSVLNGKVTSAEFANDDSAVSIDEPVIEYDEDDEPIEDEISDKDYSLGALTGRIITIWSTPLKIALRDDVTHKLVYCYPREDQQELAREHWGKRVTIAGLIARDKETAVPHTIRSIKSIDLIQDVPRGSYRQARGVLPWKRGDEPSEITIRRMRDA